jgi:glycine cleavage system transcriptional repressor
MQIVVTVMGEDRPDLIAELTRVIKDAKCNILESRMTELGQEFAAHILVEGNWNHVVRLESLLDATAQRSALKLVTMRGREEEESPTEEVIPYTVDVFAGDQPDNIHELAEFFTSRNIKILDLSTSRYPAPYSGTPVFLAHMIVKIPVGMKIVSLRDEFLEFCDQLNLDAILEPVKR